MSITAKLSGGMSLREAELPRQAECQPVSANCWRRATCREAGSYYSRPKITGGTYQSASKELTVTGNAKMYQKR
jgi:hypothetical protein